MDPTVATFAGFIGERTDAPTMAVVITGDITDLIIAPTTMGLIVGSVRRVYRRAYRRGYY